MIRKKTLDKVMHFATMLKQSQSDPKPLFKLAKTAGLHTGIPTIMMKMGYVRKTGGKADPAYTCNYETFEPIMARKVLESLYDQIQPKKEQKVEYLKVNSALMNICDSDLIEELKSRGYTGTLTKQFDL